MEDQQQKKIDYVRGQLNRASSRARAYAYDSEGQERPRRNCFVLLNKYLRNFETGQNRQSRWLAISGLRGTGKTTLMAQLYLGLLVDPQRKLFISVDHAVQLLDSSITEIIDIYEQQLGQAIESITEPIYLFFDEVQYDPKWAIALKSIYDRSSNVFVMSTGSSALELNANPDTARRVIIETLLPMSFTEYQKISNGVFEAKGLGSELRNSIKNANNAEDIYTTFSSNASKVGEYWASVSSTEINKYLQYGTLPFMASLGNTALAFDQLERSIDRIIGGDVLKIGLFGAETIARIPQILYSVADSDVTSVNALSATLGIPRPTLTRIFNALEKAEVLYKLEPTGSHTSQIRQPDKYMFTTPAIRAMYFTLTGSTRASQQVLGHLLEDTVVMYLRRIFGERSLTTAINYSNSAGTADFMVRLGVKQYVIETGLGSKTSRQIVATKVAQDNRIGIIISNNELSLDKVNNIVTLPIRQFVLV